MVPMFLSKIPIHCMIVHFPLQFLHYALSDIPTQPIWCVASHSPDSYQIFPIYHEILKTRERNCLSWGFFCDLRVKGTYFTGVPGEKPSESDWDQLKLSPHTTQARVEPRSQRWEARLMTTKPPWLPKNGRQALVRIKVLQNTTKMMSKCRKCHLRETKFAKFPWGIPLDPTPYFPAKGVGKSALCWDTFNKKATNWLHVIWRSEISLIYPHHYHHLQIHE